MAWLAADYMGEHIFNHKPDICTDETIEQNYWLSADLCGAYEIHLPKGSIKKLIGRELKCEDGPVEI